MAFQKGQSGNPGGRPKDKPWADALRRAVFREDAEGKRRLQAIAERCATAAEAGDMQAIREIGDRLDGKPMQESSVSFEHPLSDVSPDDLEILRAALVNERDQRAADGSGEAHSGKPH